MCSTSAAHSGRRPSSSIDGRTSELHRLANNARPASPVHCPAQTVQSSSFAAMRFVHTKFDSFTAIDQAEMNSIESIENRVFEKCKARIKFEKEFLFGRQKSKITCSMGTATGSKGAVFMTACRSAEARLRSAEFETTLYQRKAYETQ